MATDPLWGSRHVASSWWRRRWTRNERIFAAILVLLLIVLFWQGWQGQGKKLAEVKPPLVAGVSAPAKPASAILPPPATTASAPAKGVSDRTAAKAAVPAASQPKASASTPQQAKKEEKKDAKKGAVTTPVVTAPKTDATPTFSKEATSAPAATPPQGKPYLWTKVGADPCNPKVGCTLQWALEQSKWPAGVQSALRDKVRGESPQTYTMRSGWQGWMTWGKAERKFRSNTLTQWPSGQAEAADLWSTAYEGVNYNLVRVAKCKNWGGFTTVAQAPAQPIPAASSGVMPLGVIPTVACPEETE